MKKTFLVGVVLLLAASTAFAAARVEKIGAFSGDASEKIKAALEPGGYKIFLPNTLECCEIWLAAKVPVSKNDAQAANYPQFSRSEFLGVITFPKGGMDFRGQAIRPGSYAMRYELLPNDGNHLGVAPNPDFILLTPLSSDSDPAATYDFAELVKLSSQAAHSTHPAAFETTPPEKTDSASVTQTDDAWIVFTAKVTGADGSAIPVSLVVKGSAAQ